MQERRPRTPQERAIRLVQAGRRLEGMSSEQVRETVQSRVQAVGKERAQREFATLASATAAARRAATRAPGVDTLRQVAGVVPPRAHAARPDSPEYAQVLARSGAADPSVRFGSHGGRVSG